MIMRPPSFRSRRRPRRFWGSAALALVAACAVEGSAKAQACCAGATTISPGRLAPHEDGLVGLQARLTSNTGSFDGRGSYLRAPDSTIELDFGEDLIAAVRFLPELQLALLVPIVETWRKVPAQSELGGGFGDINLAARWDLMAVGESLVIPAISLLFGMTFPTGTAPDRAIKRLATDATGIGAAQTTLGMSLEQIYADHLLLNLTGLLSQRLPHSARGIRETLGLQLVTSFAAGWAFSNGAGLAIAIRYETERNATVNGKKVEDTGRRITSLALLGGVSLAEGWRLQASLLQALPFSGLGQNETVGIGITAALLRTW